MRWKGVIKNDFHSESENRGIYLQKIILQNVVEFL